MNGLPKPNQNKDKDNGEKGGGGLPGMPGGGGLARWWPLLLILGIFVLPWIVTLFAGLGGGGNTIAYSTFVDQLEQGNVQSVQIRGERISGQLSSAISREGTSVQSFTTYFPSQVEQSLLNRLQGQNVQVFTQPSSDGGGFLGILLNFLPILLLIWIFSRMYRAMQQRGGGAGGGIFNVGQSKAKRYGKEQTRTSFDDVAGAEAAKNQLEEMVSFLKNPTRFRKLGANPPKGVLLVGPPGTGKTLLARAVAGEAEVPFFFITGSDFMEMFVGVGASRVRNMFKDAKKSAPSIIFIDELDSIGRRRGAGLGGGHDEREQTLNQLLSELDGFEPNQQVIVMGATNRPDILDPALQRPGRFDRRITVNFPPRKARVEILKIHTRNKPMAEDVDYDRIARNTPGFSGADLENLANEAALIAAQEEAEEITNEHLDRARDKIILGLERKNIVLGDREKQIVAYHESGHAVVGALLAHTEPIHKVTIIPRENSMGVTQQLPEEDRYIYERNYLLDRLAVMMGGRAAEHLKADTMTSGAENDLQQARKLARKMVLEWGMGEAFRNIAMGNGGGNVFLGEEIAQRREYSDETNRILDKEVKAILDEAFERAEQTLKDNRDGFDEVASVLLEEEEMSGERVYDILGIEHKRKTEEPQPRQKETAS